MFEILDLTSGISWSLTYIAAIYLGFKHRTWCLPSLAICQNFSWELLMVLNRCLSGLTDGVAFWVQLIWLILDVGILITWLLYDQRKPVRKIGLLSIVALLMYIFAYKFRQWEITAFVINAIMSAAFIYRFTKDKTNWTSDFISVFKLIGTLAATLANGVLLKQPLLLWIGGICFALDLYYVAVVRETNSPNSKW